MTQTKALTVEAFQYILSMTGTYHGEMAANKQFGQLTQADEPKACENNLFKVMKLIKIAAGDNIFASLY